MAIIYLFTDDFETGDLSKWDVVNNPSNFSVHAGAAYTGSFGLDADLSGAEQSFLQENITAGYITYYLDWYNRIHQVEVSPRGAFKKLQSQTGSRTHAGMVIRNYAGTWKVRIVYYDGVTEQWVDTTEVISSNTWYHFRIILRISPSGEGFVRFYKDNMSSPFYEVTGLSNYDASNLMNQIEFLFQCGAGNQVVEDIDDVECYNVSDVWDGEVGFKGIATGASAGCGDISIERVLSWHEEEAMSIPVKKIVRRNKPTTEAEYWVRTPRKIILDIKATRTKKVELEDCKCLAGWVELYDFDNSFIDWVWIESLNWNWARDEDHNYPWQARIVLICSTT